MGPWPSCASRLHRCRRQEVVAQSQSDRVVHVDVDESARGCPQQQTDSGCTTLGHVLEELPDCPLIFVLSPPCMSPRRSVWPIVSLTDRDRLIPTPILLNSPRDFNFHVYHNCI